MPRSPIIRSSRFNPAFERLTGYSVEEAAGRNGRFLQGTDTDRESVRRIHDAIEAQQEVNGVLLNYRKDGTTFWNDLTIAPVRDDDANVTHYIGVQNDVSARKRAPRRSCGPQRKARRLRAAPRASSWRT